MTARGHVVFHGRSSALGAVVDVSATGLRARLAAHGARCDQGERVALEVRLDGARGGWHRLFGRVVRLELEGDVIVALDEPPPDFDDAIQEQLLAMLESDAIDHVLLVDPVAWRRIQLAATMRATGCRVSEAATPLEALAHLGESREHFSVIAVADSTPSSVADELRAYLGKEHQRLRVVTAGAWPPRLSAAGRPRSR